MFTRLQYDKSRLQQWTRDVGGRSPPRARSCSKTGSLQLLHLTLHLYMCMDSNVEGNEGVQKWVSIMHTFRWVSRWRVSRAVDAAILKLNLFPFSFLFFSFLSLLLFFFFFSFFFFKLPAANMKNLPNPVRFRCLRLPTTYRAILLTPTYK